MYLRFFGLRERPFDLTSNPKYVVMTPQHREALSTLDYGLSASNGITLLVGAAGTGKTTLLRTVLGSCGFSSKHTRAVFLNNPTLTRQEFLDSLAHGFQLTPEAARSKSRFLRELECALTECRRNDTIGALVVDEAQSLPYDLLEEVRLLANIQSKTETLLRVILAGQPGLADRLNDSELRQLKQRVGLRCALVPLDLRETALYIAHRISLAGGNPGDAFSRDAIIAIHERPGGIPRTINVLCENALLTGFAADQRPVGPELVLEVCRDFDLPATRRTRSRVVPEADLHAKHAVSQ
jgi:general secretion pathway protein A